MRAIDADAVPQEFWEYEFDGKWRGCTIKDLLDSQPTIQPDIVRCKDCKHWKDSDGVFRRGTGVESKCPLNLHQVYEGTFFCGLAERREVTENVIDMMPSIFKGVTE